jgi:hypothetical protein
MVMSDKKLPAMPDTRAVTAMREQEIAQRLDDMRRDLRVQAMQEQRVIRYVCAVTGNRFSVTLRRESPDGAFRISAIQKETTPPEQRGPFSGLFKKAARKTYSIEEMDLAGWCCPWCGSDNSVTECSGCKESVCMGRGRLMRGKEWFFCHSGCGASFQVVDSVEVRGERGAPPSLGAPSRQALPGGYTLRLPKK